MLIEFVLGKTDFHLKTNLYHPGKLPPVAVVRSLIRGHQTRLSKANDFELNFFLLKSFINERIC